MHAQYERRRDRPACESPPVLTLMCSTTDESINRRYAHPSSGDNGCGEYVPRAEGSEAALIGNKLECGVAASFKFHVLPPLQVGWPFVRLC